MCLQHPPASCVYPSLYVSGYITLQPSKNLLWFMCLFLSVQFDSVWYINCVRDQMSVLFLLYFYLVCVVYIKKMLPNSFYQLLSEDIVRQLKNEAFPDLLKCLTASGVKKSHGIFSAKLQRTWSSRSSASRLSASFLLPASKMSSAGEHCLRNGVH